MLEFILNYKYVFIIIAVLIVFAIIGYYVDKKRYNKYKKEILDEANVNTIQSDVPVTTSGVATPISVNPSEVNPGDNGVADSGVQSN